MVNTSCASRTPLSGCRPTGNNCSRTPCAACTNDLEIRIGVPNSLHNFSRRAASFTAGPITVKFEAVGGAYVAVRDFPSVQRNVQAQGRIPALSLFGIERLDSR